MTAALVTVIFLATGWGSAVASNISSVFVTNTAADPVPVQATGTVPVHEQGTANVNVTNTSVAVSPPAPITGGIGSSGNELIHTSGGTGTDINPGVSTATALVVHLTAGIAFVEFSYQGNETALFTGPANEGSADVQLALTRPIRFDTIRCMNSELATDFCAVSWIGNS